MDKDGRFVYDKHKIFLYKEDFEKFSQGLEEVIQFIKEKNPTTNNERNDEQNVSSSFSDVSFEEL
jgi:hypothetical protein